MAIKQIVILQLFQTAFAQEITDRVACTDTSECTVLNSYFECKPVPEGETREHGGTSECVHKDLWPLYPKEWVGTFVFSLIMLLSNVAGIGGGGIAIPMAIYFFNIQMKPAIAISSFSIACATMTRFFYNLREKHPEKKNVVCIDYGMTTVMMPLTLIGSLIGAYIYKSFPDLILTIILTLLLFLLSLQSMKKYNQIRQKEIDQEQKTKQVETEMAVQAAAQESAVKEGGDSDHDAPKITDVS